MKKICLVNIIVFLLTISLYANANFDLTYRSNVNPFAFNAFHISYSNIYNINMLGRTIFDFNENYNNTYSIKISLPENEGPDNYPSTDNRSLLENDGSNNYLPTDIREKKLNPAKNIATGLMVAGGGIILCTALVVAIYQLNLSKKNRNEAWKTGGYFMMGGAAIALIGLFIDFVSPKYVDVTPASAIRIRDLEPQNWFFRNVSYNHVSNNPSKKQDVQYKFNLLSYSF